MANFLSPHLFDAKVFADCNNFAVAACQDGKFKFDIFNLERCHEGVINKR